MADCETPWSTASGQLIALIFTVFVRPWTGRALPYLPHPEL